jgi:hypothetical protein
MYLITINWVAFTILYMFKQLLRNKRRKIFSIKKEPKRKMLANKALW